MPIKYKRRKKTYKRKRRRSMYSLAPRLGVPSGIARQQTVRLRYCEFQTISSATGSLGITYFRANDVYDPRTGSGGHQPMGYDTWASLYNHYVVVSSTCKVLWTGDTAITNPFVCGTYLDDDGTMTYTSGEEFIEAGKGSHAVAIGRQSIPLRTSSRFNAKKFFNITDIKDNRDELGARVGTNPIDQAHFAIWFQMLNAGTDTVNYQVVIDYTVVFSEPKTLPQS